MSGGFTGRGAGRRGRPIPLSGVALGLALGGRLGKEIAARAAWAEAAGPTLAARLPVLRLEGDRLILALPGPEWREVLEQHEPLLRRRMMRHPRLTGLCGIIGEIDPVAARRAGLASDPPPVPSSGGPAGERLERLAAALLARRKPGNR